MERTKKMLRSISYGDINVKRNEFLVPSPTENGKLIGIESGKVYIYGMICYIGVEILCQDIIGRMNRSKIAISDMDGYQIILRRYMDELYRYKISNVITSSQDSQENIVLIKVAERAPQQIPTNRNNIIYQKCHGTYSQVGKGDSQRTNLSKEEKRALTKKWKAAQNKKYLLNKTKVQKLFCYLESQLAETSCDNTLHFTEQWLKDHLPQEIIENVIAEIKEMGGYCDCEVLFNCYRK